MGAFDQLSRLVDDSSGTTAVEYALLASAIAGIIVVVVYLVGAKARNLYTNAATGW
jgi:Flp pilus assembly pilin Flp